MPEQATLTTQRANGNDGGFWGNVGAGLGSALGKIAGDVLPIWSAKQLLGDDAAAAIANPARVNMGDNSMLNQAVLSVPGKAAKYNILGFEIDTMGLIVMGVGGTLLFLLLRKM